MTFDFQALKPVIQAEFDEVMQYYPTDLSAVRARVPVGGDAYERKLAAIETAAELCPVHVFGHFPFAFELDIGQDRQHCHCGIGSVCREKSGVDFSPLWQFRKLLIDTNTGTFNDYTDHLHRTIDYNKLLDVGFSGVYEDCRVRNLTETDEGKRRYRETVMRACLAVRKIGERLRRQAAEKLITAEGEFERYNYARMAGSPNTPWDAPVTMFDALNSLLCAALFISGLEGLAMNTVGHIDRLICPFYERDLAAGRITKEEAVYLIRCFLFKTDAHIHYDDKPKSFDNGVTIMIGGCDTDGTPVYNEITDMILDAYHENKFIHPKLNARAGSYSPKAYLRRLGALTMTGNNNLIVENDDYIVPMFERMGLSPEDARCYIGGGCQEVITRNQLHSRAFTYLNLAQVLLDTLYGSDNKIYRYGSFAAEDFEALYASFLANLRSYIRVLAEEFAPYERIHPEINPEPLLSAMTADCVGRGQDISAGGALCYNKTLSLVGFGTLCDSLLSLREAYAAGTADVLKDAVRANFEGYELLRREIRRSDARFGHSADADAFAAKLAEDLSKVSRGIYNGQGIEWHTSLFTYYVFHRFGQQAGATPDGRLAGESLSRQMNMASPPELTAAALSLSKLSGAEFDDVGMLDVALPLSKGQAFRDALADYMETCVKLKIPVLQFNAIDREMLEEERDHKGTHPDAVVRVCGYSAFFGLLTKDMQNEIIGRLDA